MYQCTDCKTIYLNEVEVCENCSLETGDYTDLLRDKDSSITEDVVFEGKYAFCNECGVLFSESIEICPTCESHTSVTEDFGSIAAGTVIAAGTIALLKKLIDWIKADHKANKLLYANDSKLALLVSVLISEAVSLAEDPSLKPKDRKLISDQLRKITVAYQDLKSDLVDTNPAIIKSLNHTLDLVKIVPSFKHSGSDNIFSTSRSSLAYIERELKKRIKELESPNALVREGLDTTNDQEPIEEFGVFIMSAVILSSLLTALFIATKESFNNVRFITIMFGKDLKLMSLTKRLMFRITKQSILRKLTDDDIQLLGKPLKTIKAGYKALHGHAVENNPVIGVTMEATITLVENVYKLSDRSFLKMPDNDLDYIKSHTKIRLKEFKKK